MSEGFTVWLTGLPGSGKTTIAHILAEHLKKIIPRPIEVLDGDILRKTLSQDLEFSKEDRDTHIRRVYNLCYEQNLTGKVSIASVISPYRLIREEARKKIKNFVEVYLWCPLEVLIQRDVKGFYKKAIAGEIKNFTGISDPYEEPLAPEVRLDTSQQAPDESAGEILDKLSRMGLIP
jgi:adenylyl-sulfate kinase